MPVIKGLILERSTIYTDNLESHRHEDLLPLVKMLYRKTYLD